MSSFTEEDHFEDTATFSQQDGFRVAVALIDTGSYFYENSEDKDDHYINPNDYFSIHAGLNSVTKDYIDIKGEICTAADLGLVPETPSTMFYPLKPNQMNDL